MTHFSTICLARAVLGASLAFLGMTAALAQSEVRANRAFGVSQPIPGRYIVVFKDSVADPAGAAEAAVRGAGGRRHHTFSKALKGFAATLPEDAVERLRKDPSVAQVEQDHTISLSQVQSPATWGLDRIDQVDRPLDMLYNYNYTGAGVHAFIIDTGIRADHVEFGTRILSGFTSIADGNGTNDCDGHGTHVAGTVGGATLGVARQVSLTPVRVLDCTGSGTWSGVIAGIDWVANSTRRPAVANMSLGGSMSTTINAAVASAVAKGVTMVVAAGNENSNACRTSPASEPSAITVGATSSSDARASFSNFGSCVDLFAPGVSITSAWNTSPTATNTISGTSMAAPHVAGVAALALQANPAASPIAVTNFLLAHASANKLSAIGSGSPNLLLYSVAAGAPTEPPPATLAVKSLTGRASKVNRDWKATVTVTIRNVVTGTVAPNATVEGTFAPGGAGQCLTSASGVCQIASGLLSPATATVFTVTGVSAGGGAVYDPSQNSASQITVNRR